MLLTTSWDVGPIPFAASSSWWPLLVIEHSLLWYARFWCYIYSLCSVRLYKSAAASALCSISLLTCLLSYRIKNMLQYLYLMCFINVCYAMLQGKLWSMHFASSGLMLYILWVKRKWHLYATAQNRDKRIMIISYCNMVDV